jgi:hypothetical protein
MSENLNTTPTIPPSVYDRLPELLKECTDHFENPRERDVVLTSALVVLSGCFVGIRGKYDKDLVGPNLYAFVVAPPASGKGVAKYPKKLGQHIHAKLLAETEKNKAAYTALIKKSARVSGGNTSVGIDESTDLPSKPRLLTLFIPGNSSAASIFDLLYENGGGIIYETEADTLSGSLKQDWGNFTDILRKAFHHETISISRRTNSELKEVVEPNVSTFLSGTPDQVFRLIKTAEDGLVSRILFYIFKQEVQWKDRTPCDACPDISDFFLDKGEEVERISNWLKQERCRFSLTRDQFKRLNAFFEGKIELIKKFENEGAESTVNRLGLICFRLAMILTVLRQVYPESTTGDFLCTNEDLELALELSDTYFHHSMIMLSMLPKHSKSQFNPKLSQFYSVLPDDTPFFTSLAITKGKEIGIKPRTVTNYLNDLTEMGYIQKIGHGIYLKLTK